MSQDTAYQLSVKPEWSHDQLLNVLGEMRANGYLNIILVLPGRVRGLQTLDDFYRLRKAGRDLGLALSFAGGNKTMRGLAKLLGLPVIEVVAENGQAAEQDSQTGSGMFWETPTPPPPPPSHSHNNSDTGIMLAIATIKALLISKGVFNEEEYQQMLNFVEQQWKSRPN